MLNGFKLLKSLFSTDGKWQLKTLLTLIAFSIVIAVVIFTQLLVDELIQHEQRIIKLYSNTYKHYSDPNKNLEYLIFFLDEITPTITFPVIMTDANDEPLEDFASYTLNINLSKMMTIEEQRAFLKRYIQKMRENYEPIIIEDENGVVVQKIYYTHSELIDRLRLFPFVSLIIISAFIAIGYVAFSSVRKNEQSKVWVGMAREAAHQLGTPLSSLLAWLEILRYSKDDPKAVEDTINEMSNDINRLQIITTRFSKIGSMPEKEHIELNTLIDDVCRYFEKRLPHLGRKVEIIREFSENITVEANQDLLAWVFENLLKNAAEAIDHKEGKITIRTAKVSHKFALIYVEDNGKGLTSKVRRNLFYPGFTTKKRGWGLGLSLAKRIIEDYHNGKIFVKETQLGKGTTFAIEIPLKN
jgi:signal transduction histidine kinase